MTQSTSREAYSALGPVLGERQREVLHILQYSPVALCGWDIANKLGVPPNYVSPRIKELVDQGLVSESHRAVYRPTNRKAIYWQAIV
ncbi:helix-turn-helix DNA binding domain protein [Mycobacterium phage Gail]|uniref:Helix-turn-helix DNA binding domain protein n=2 Tax=Luchadorvirus TaxID=2948807 RepID=A0A7D5G270_9CAUD|nr:helix-turn-helix DNA-binding domain protein [Mycobacterium phage Luchador]YP_010109418.1 helix-turn-helix DNA-binding domain protein [Mycobacterium phage Gail]AKF14231.1 helix-turn-helix DNA binding domain protein [Mycobacterium phage Luchador]QLF84630.1 helix-turn-helix DNA binding domain protein [Mycobacterium phage Gail]